MFHYVNRQTLTATLIALTLGTNTNVFASPINLTQINDSSQYIAQMNNRGDGFWGDGRFLNKLNLTPEQTTQIQQIRQKYQNQIGNLRNNLRSEQQKLKEMMNSDQPTANLRTQNQKIVALNQQLHSIRFESMLEIREVLTPQQRQQFTQMMEQKGKNGRSPQ